MNKKYQIDWAGGSITYYPGHGVIQNNVNHERIQIGRNVHSFFPIVDDLVSEKFKPFCLTIFPGHQCNLACDYCYVSEKDSFPVDSINFSAIEAAADFVAGHCADRGEPFVLGFHGGNEPLLQPNLIQSCLDVCQNTADKYDLDLLPYCTTNGVISEKTAEWAAQTFHGITLSWDGPAHIHDRHRTLLNGKPTSSNVQRTAEIFLNPANNLRHLKVRTTVTHDSVESLLEIVDFFHKQEIQWIDIFPVYPDSAKLNRPELLPDSRNFVKNFLLARKWANQHNMTLGYAGSRLADIHDKYCPVYQNNFTITPDGYVTACFLATNNYDSRNMSFLYGWYDENKDQLMIEWDRLRTIFQKLAEPFAQCENCFNFFHCDKHCPEVCPLRINAADMKNFDCTKEKWIGLANLIEAAGFNIPEEKIEDCLSFFASIEVKGCSDP